ncbi:MAG: hypothetical protein ABFD53_00015 [Anaerolineaceae bacterium]
MRIIRASEIGTFCYCQRAWWYQISGIQAGNRSELNQGVQVHKRHNLHILEVEILRYLGIALVVAAVGILIAFLSQW